MTEIFKDGWETAQNFTTNWTDSGGDGTHSETVESLNPHHGTYNALFACSTTNSESWAYKTITPTPIANLRFYIKIFGGLPTANNTRVLLGQLENTAAGSITSPLIQYIDGELYWGLYIDGELYWEATPSNPTTGVWYLVEIERDNTNNKQKLWVDEALKVSRTDDITGDNDRIYVGCTYLWGYAASFSCAVDCVKVADGYIGLETQYTLTIIAENGTTEPEAGQHQYNPNAEVEITPDPDEGYYFSHWLLDGDEDGNDIPYVIIMDTDYTLEAVFVLITYTLTVNSEPVQNIPFTVELVPP